MARYIVVRVESNETADKLLERFAPVPAIQVLGVFASGTKFCEGKCEDRRLIRSKKWGTTHCSVCRLPVTSISQQPRNLLRDPELHPRFNDLWLTVWEPFEPPEKKYGEDSIERKKLQARGAKEKIARHKQRNRRRRRSAGEED